VISQWASEVIGYSSQYTDSGWSAAQALGEPNTFSYGDNVTPTASAALIANDDVVLWTAKDTAVIIDPAELLGNDKSADNASLQITHLSATNGTLQLLPDGTYRFTPAAGFVGLAQLAYTVSNGMTTANAVASLFVLQFRPAPGVRLPRNVYDALVEHVGSIAQDAAVGLILQNNYFNPQIVNASAATGRTALLEWGSFNVSNIETLAEALRLGRLIPQRQESLENTLSETHGYTNVIVTPTARMRWVLSTTTVNGERVTNGRVVTAIEIGLSITATAPDGTFVTDSILIRRIHGSYHNPNFANQTAVGP
jgi:hypothetical protein